jgi:predicted small integral membrane protein
LGIETTRGDRLFISILGTVFIMLAWLGLYGTPLWGGLAIAIVWWVLVWKKV